MSETAITIGLLALVAVIGLWVGHWKIKGVGLGISGVLFGGIIAPISPHNTAFSLIATRYILCKNLA